MDDAVENFMAFTSASSDVARRYLGLTDNNFEQAIALFFDSPELASGLEQSSAQPTLPVQVASQPDARFTNRTTSKGAIHIDSDEDMDAGEDDEEEIEASRAAAVGRVADVEDDEAIARRMQEELYAGGDSSGGYDADGVRAPIGRRTETLVGGTDDDYVPGDMQAAVQQQLRARAAARATRLGVFNQAPVPSMWDESADPDVRRRGLARATGGASESSSKAAKLTELYRPPFDIMNQISWDVARDKGKEEGKWILVNVQAEYVFDCQLLNRDIWKHDGIKELIKENFIFIQYNKEDPRGTQYVNYYFPLKDSDAAYPHIAIVDPRTGEQVKVWSGPPNPSPGDFLMQLVEFLDRYSLDVTKKNPVARRKPEKAHVDVNRLSEDEMLDLALQNSLAPTGGAGHKEEDPDELTKRSGDMDKGKAKEVDEDMPDAKASHSQSSSASPFSHISSTDPHVEPSGNPGNEITRIQFRHSNGRVVRKFRTDETVRRMFEWLKAEPLEGKAGLEFDLKGQGKDFINYLDETIADAGLKNGTVMVEYTSED